ncbi:uncharacterized protein LOC114668155 [Erpetoichthys calabaricus]|uniref:uncharacterized protein LOC114668155 n=1 Tax=Erpetoichthys calabaricus TaxID=27687 RepID=UPI002234D299|nr:uncharacterized protein LOC114668155 [Erpetoichthys calabaricus]
MPMETRTALEKYERLRADLEEGLLTERGFHEKVRALLQDTPSTSQGSKSKDSHVIGVKNHDRLRIIRNLFEQGYTQKEMVKVIEVFGGGKISDRQLRRLLHKMKLFRRSNDRPKKEIFAAVESELKKWPPMKGVRAMYRRVRDFRGIRPCYRNDVHEVMRQLDARGLHRRQPGNRKILRCQYSTKGPNHTWHIDGNDKLRFYGIWIHLCIDGYSRRVIWLHAGTSNRNPRFIARYFLDAVETENGCPRLVRADRGCENSLVAIIQMSFRYRHHDSLAGVNSFRYGKSIHNQRAEYFNGYLKKSWISFWQKHFEVCNVDVIRVSLIN